MIINSTQLKKLRERKKLSQLELANQLDLSQATIWEWEKEDHNVKLEHVLKLCKVLEIEMAELTKDGEMVNINNQSANKLVENTALGFEVTPESYQLQKELTNSLKKQVTFLENEVERLKTK